jgi:hypothetical protein
MGLVSLFFLLCPHMGRRSKQTLPGLFHKDTNPIDGIDGTLVAQPPPKATTYNATKLQIVFPHKDRVGAHSDHNTLS